MTVHSKLASALIGQGPSVSNGAYLHRFRQSSPRVARGNEFLCYVTREARLGDGTRDRRIVELLRRVDLVSSRHAGGVIVTDVPAIVADRSDDIALHDLHVVDVVKELESLRAHFLREGDAPWCPVALIIRVIHLRVEQLHAYPDTVALGRRHQRGEATRTRVEPLL